MLGKSGDFVEVTSKLVDGFEVALFSAKGISKFLEGAEFAEWVELEDSDVFEIREAIVSIFFQETFHDLVGQFAILGEVVPLLNVVRPFSAGQWLGIKCDVADEIKWVEG